MTAGRRGALSRLAARMDERDVDEPAAIGGGGADRGHHRTGRRRLDHGGADQGLAGPGAGGSGGAASSRT